MSSALEMPGQFSQQGQFAEGAVSGQAFPPTEQVRPPVESRPARMRSKSTGGRATSLGLFGVITVLVSAWGGIIPYVGPSFSFGADGTGSWYWSLQHSVLYLIPGAVGVVAGLIMVAAILLARVGNGQGILAVAGLLAVLSGAWFVLGPFVWPVLHSGAITFVPTSAGTGLAHIVGYNLGPGLILVACGSVEMAASRPPRRTIRMA